MLSFVDAYSGYNQIMMKKEEEETTFVMKLDTFFFQVMPFGLKIVGATFQHLMDKTFEK